MLVSRQVMYGQVRTTRLGGKVEAEVGSKSQTRQARRVM